MITDCQLDAEIKATEARLKKLNQLRFLRLQTEQVNGQNRYAEEVMEMVKIACAERCVSEVLLLSPNRSGLVAETRFIIIHLLRKHTPASLQSIGRVLKRDHRAILNGERRALSLIESYADFARQVGVIEAKYLMGKVAK